MLFIFIAVHLCANIQDGFVLTKFRFNPTTNQGVKITEKSQKNVERALEDENNLDEVEENLNHLDQEERDEVRGAE